MVNLFKKIEEANGNVVKWIIAPLLIFSLILFVILPEFRPAGVIALILGFWALFFYLQPAYQEDLLGIQTATIFPAILLGALVPIGFWLVNKMIFPLFVIGMPNISLSIGSDVRFILIVVIFPWLEEVALRGATIAFLMKTYGISEWKANLIQAWGIFLPLHLLAYGVLLSAYKSWIEVYGAFNAISGLFLAVGIMGTIFGWIGRKDGVRNLVANGLAHSLVNLLLFTGAVVSFVVAVI